MNKKLWSSIGFLMIVTVLLAACAPSQTATPVTTEAPAEAEEPAAPSLQGTVTLWHSLKEGEIEGMTAATQAFQEQYPDVTFDVLFIPDEDKRGKYETAVAAGGGPTMLIGSADWGPAFYDAALVTDLSDMASPEFLQGINQAALDSVSYKDALVGLPLGLKGVVMFRNTSIIPEAPATYEDLVAAAQAATSGNTVGANLERGPFFVFGHLHGVGGQLMAENGDPAFNSAEGVQWMELIDSFSEAGPTSFNDDNDVNLFKTGNAGIIIDGTWNLNDLAAAIGEENLTVDPWPSPLSGYVQNDNLYLSSTAEGDNKAVTWAFMEYILTPEAQAIIAENNTGFIPAALGVEVTDRLRQEAVTAFQGGVAFPVIPEMGAYWSPMETAEKSVFDEGVDPAAALQQAEESIDAAIVDIRGG